jgi:flagellar secretion chaperone FliS
MYANRTNPYQTQAVETAGPAKLVLMLYDRALLAITRSRTAAGPGAIETVNTELLRAQDILTELLVTLDHQRGGAVASNLASLYEFCLDRLAMANVRKDMIILDEVEPVVQGLRDAWEQSCCGTGVAVG